MKPLRVWRAGKTLSQQALAELAGVSNKTISEIENPDAGKAALTTFRTMRRLSKALGVDAAEVTEFAAAIEERGKEVAVAR